jgi:hypothetical protein
VWSNYPTSWGQFLLLGPASAGLFVSIIKNAPLWRGSFILINGGSFLPTLQPAITGLVPTDFAFCCPLSNLLAVSSAYLRNKLARPLPTKDGGTLRTVLDVRAYMLRLPKDRELRAQWQHAVALLMAQADVDIFSRQVELALL